MPHKRNPVKSEQLCGLARVSARQPQAGLENVALWHERDISHSSVERDRAPRLADARVLHGGEVPRHRRGARRAPRADAARTSTRRTGSCSASRCCSRWSSAVSTRDDAYRARAARRDAHVGGAPAVPRRARRRSRGHRASSTPTRSTRASTSTARSRTPARAVDALDDAGRRRMSRDRSRCPHHYTGKVRELYEVGHDRMLIVASDRISVFDVVLARRDPRQGPRAHRAVDVLVRADRRTSCRTTWCRPTPPTSPRPRAPRSRAGRCSCAPRARCGSSASPAATCSARRGPSTRRPARCRAARSRRAAPGRAAARADLHARPPRPSRATTCRSPTPRRPRSSATTSSSSCATSRCAVYEFGAAHAACAGRDPRRHQARVRRPIDDELLVIDEMLTPDSSRYWPAEDYAGRRLAAVVRQAVRARPLPVARLGPDAARAAAARPRDRRAHARATSRPTSCITGESFDELVRRKSRDRMA